MKMQKRNEGNNWWQIIAGIAMVLIGIFAWRTPGLGTGTVVYLIAFMAILRGINLISARSNLNRFTVSSHTWMLVIGIIDIIIGIFILFNSFEALVALPFVLAVWFIIESIGIIVIAFRVRELSTGRFILGLILGIIGIVLGIYLFRNPVAGFWTIEVLVATYFIVNGIFMVIEGFLD